MSQTDFGNRCDVSQATVSLWENGRHPIGPEYEERLEQLAVSAGVDLTEGSGTPPDDGGKVLFGEWLQGERVAQGLSRVDLAARSGVSYQQIRNLEIGESATPQERTRHALESALGTATPDAVEQATEQEAEIEDVGSFLSFDPFDEGSYPEEPGVYVFYDVADHVLYVGESGNIRARLRARYPELFWFRPQLVKSANYVRIESEALRKQIERTMIKFLKSNAVFNQQHVEREP